MTDWRQFFAPTPNHSLEYFPPSIIDGIPVVNPPRDVFDEGAAMWKNSIVAQFLGKPPSFSLIQRTLTKLWEKKGVVTINQAGPNLYIMQFDDDDDDDARTWVLENGPWHVIHIPMIVRKWEPDMGKFDFNHDKLPLWFHLHNIPLDLYSRKGISYLASAIGVPLYMDSITASRKRLAYAKLCIEVSAALYPPELIHVTLKNRSKISIGVSIPWKPLVCRVCNTFGHTDKACLEKKKTTQVWKPKEIQPLDLNVNAQDHDEILEEALASATVALPLGVLEQSTKDALPLEALEQSTEDANGICSPNEKWSIAVGSKSSKRASNASFSGNRKSIADGYASGKKKHLIASSSNKFKALCEDFDTCIDYDSETEYDEEIVIRPIDDPAETWKQLVNNAKHSPRKQREAAKGVERVLMDMRKMKAQILAKGAQKKPSHLVRGRPKR